MTNHSQLFPDKKEKIDFGIAITVILIFLAAIIYYLYGTGRSNQALALDNIEQTSGEKTTFNYTNTKEETLLSNIENEEVGEGLVDDDLSTSQKIEEVIINDAETKISTETTENINSISDNTEPEQLIEKELPVYLDEEEEPSTEEKTPYQETETQIQKKEEVAIVEKEEPKEYDVEEERISEEVSEEVADDPAPKEVESNNKDIKLKSSESDNAYGCIVIVGSFEDPSNSKTLIKQLEKEGYPVYEGAYRGYYVVGVNSDCATTKITPLLKKLRKDYEKEAWIYKR